MAEMTKNIVLHIEGMSCASCEYRIEKKLSDTAGILRVKVSFPNQKAEVSYDSDVIDRKDIERIVEELDYKVVAPKQEQSKTDLLGIIMILFAIYLLMKHLGFLNIFYSFPKAEEGMGYGILFLIGLLTSVHCIAMCGGINLSQCMPYTDIRDKGQEKRSILKPSFLYNLGRVISYTAIGGIVGALGSVISFSGGAKGAVQIAAGIFMIIMGLNMLHLFPALHKFIPRMPKAIVSKIYRKKNGSNSPFYVGLLNGLMPCGPLQAMQLYALSTGSPLKGALSMFLFSLGTVPLMFGLGALSKFLSQKFTQKVMTVGAFLVVILGISMLSSGMSLSGISTLAGNQSETKTAEPEIVDGVQLVNTMLSSGRYEPIQVKQGVPVKWTITAEEGTINGCNGQIIIQEYGIQKTLEVGDNVIEFTPSETGQFTYSCWMGMIRSTITVTE